MKGIPTKMGRAMCALVSSFAIMAGSAYAHSPVSSEEAGELRQLVNKASLVFQGTVAKVEYRNSEATDNEPGLPHAFVTYRMSKVYRGEQTEEMLTIRFLGGPDGSGDFFEISGVPMFQKGEENILFVKGNGSAGCPLVYCEYGRFRVHQGGVYNTHGSPVRAIIEENAIARGKPLDLFRTLSFPAPTFDGLMKNPEAQAAIKEMGLSMAEARRKYEAEAPKMLQLTKELPPVSSAQERDKAANQPTPVQPEQLKLKERPAIRSLSTTPVQPQFEGAVSRQIAAAANRRGRQGCANSNRKSGAPTPQGADCGGAVC